MHATTFKHLKLAVAAGRAARHHAPQAPWPHYPTTTIPTTHHPQPPRSPPPTTHRNQTVMSHAMGSPVARAAVLLQLCSIVVAHNGGPHGVMNVGVITVPQQQVVVVERLGKFHKMLPAGLHFCIPYPVDHLRMHDLKERPYHLAKTPGITRDNVDLIMDGVVYLRIVDAYRANYAISDPIEAMLILAQTTVCA